MAEIIWSERAIKDLDQIANYIANDSVRYAQMVVQRLFQRPQVLINNPHFGRVVPEFNIDTIRELIDGFYRIVYQVDSSKESISIITIHHSRKEFLNL